MPDKNYWIRKYEYRKEIQNLYLIVDFIESDGNIREAVSHQIIMNYEQDEFTHKKKEKEDVKISLENTPETIKQYSDHYFRESLQDVLKNIESDKNLNLEIESTGKEVFEELKDTPLFDELKKEILRGKISNLFREFLEQLDQGPISTGKTEWS